MTMTRGHVLHPSFCNIFGLGKDFYVMKEYFIIAIDYFIVAIEYSYVAKKFGLDRGY